MLINADNDDRLNFVKKVYTILAVQLTVTFGFVALVKSSPSLNEMLAADPAFAGLALTAMVVALCIQCALICCRKVARKSPTNFVLLSIFTTCWMYSIGWICAQYETEGVLTAALMTLGITIALTTYAWTTKTDFTKLCGSFVCCGIVLIIVISLFMSMLSTILYSYTEQWYPFASGFAVIVYGLFLIIDTQLIVGGKRHELSIDDYIVGALILYLDIIYLFLELLKLFGDRRR